jgi:glycopeptide antibiotics resistance protein
MVFVTSLSLFSLSGLNSMTSGIKIPHLDKIVHFTFYFFATVLGSLSIKELKPNKSLNQIANYILLFSIVYGMIIEVLQHSFTENRQGDFFDIFANSLGAFLGWLVLKHTVFKRFF